MKLTAERNFDVKYYEKEEENDIWIVESHLVDNQHEITVTLEINMEQMLIVDASINFHKYPLADCKLIENLAARLVGLKVDHSFSRNAMQITMGMEGCPNLMTLLTISVPGILYYYYPYKMSIGEITQDQFYNILREKEKNACLAHTKMFAD